MLHGIWPIATAVLVLNLPFGFWRAGVPRFSRPWFLAVHLPVPLIIAIRVVSGLGFQLSTFAVVIGACFGGQLIGGTLRRVARRPAGPDRVGRGED